MTTMTWQTGFRPYTALQPSPVFSLTSSSSKRRLEDDEDDNMRGRERDQQEVGTVKKKRNISRAPATVTTFNNGTELLQALRTAFRAGGPVDFNGSYTIFNVPPLSDKARVQQVVNEIWHATGYRFTVKDHPAIADGHKTRLWCAQDEGRIKAKYKDGEIKSRISTASGEPLAKARYPCHSRLLISSRDCDIQSTRLVTVRLHHEFFHEPYADKQGLWQGVDFQTLKATAEQSNAVTNPPPPLSETPVPSSWDRNSDDDEDDLQATAPPPLPEPPLPSLPGPPTVIAQAPPDHVVFQNRMRAHIHNIRDFCDGLEYQVQFQDWGLLHALEMEGAGFMRLVTACLHREGRVLMTPAEISRLDAEANH